MKQKDRTGQREALRKQDRKGKTGLWERGCEELIANGRVLTTERNYFAVLR